MSVSHALEKQQVEVHLSYVGGNFVQVVTQYGSRRSDRAQLNTKGAPTEWGEGEHH